MHMRDDRCWINPLIACRFSPPNSSDWQDRPTDVIVGYARYAPLEITEVRCAWALASCVFHLILYQPSNSDHLSKNINLSSLSTVQPGLGFRFFEHWVRCLPSFQRYLASDQTRSRTGVVAHQMQWCQCCTAALLKPTTYCTLESPTSICGGDVRQRVFDWWGWDGLGCVAGSEYGCVLFCTCRMLC